MSSRIKNGSLALLGQIPTVLVLAALVGLGWWGGRHDWKVDRMLGRTPPETEKKEKEDYPGVGPMTLDSPESAEKAGLETEEANLREMTQEVRANAVLAFDQTRYAQLAARVPGTAWRVFRQAGERVQKGEVLALVAAAEAGQARTNFLTALGQHDMKNEHLHHVTEAGGALPAHQVREAQMALREARLRLLTAQQTLANLGLFIRLEDLKGLSDDAAARRLRLLGLPQQMAADPGADLPANLLPLVAPFAGQVVRRDIVVGELVGPAQPQFTIADLSRLWVQLDVRQEDAGQLALGQEMIFQADSTGQSATGRLAWISPEVDPKTRTVRARAEVANPDGRLRPATFGSASVVIRLTTKVLTVPDRAVQYDGKGHMVFVRCDDSEMPNQRFCPRLILPGLRAEGHVELLDSLALLPAQTAGLLAAPGGSLGAVCAWQMVEPLLTPIRRGESVVTTGSHALRSELLKSRISGEE
jgi:cobalt-zinc-cadmium efflux system membrane fusion protein